MKKKATIDEEKNDFFPTSLVIHNKSDTINLN